MKAYFVLTERIQRLFLVVLLGAAGVVSGWGCSREKDRGAESVRSLTLVSPHPEGLKQEFERAFCAWHKDKYGETVRLVWRDLGVTGNIVQVLRNDFAQAKRIGGMDQGVGVDLFFGGGVPAARQMQSEGFLQKADVSEDVLAAIPEQLAGIRFRDPDGQWFGTTLAAFGILYNVTFHEKRGLEPPTTWNDLARPAYFGWLTLAGPKSGSARVCYELILQKNGWEAGWPILLKIFANAKTIVDSSNMVPREVATGNGLAGVCIDFYGWDTMARVGADRVRYFSPVNATAITPDPIMLLRGAPDRELACRFIEFTLSEPGQALLALPVGHKNGPKEHLLYRLPIRPDVYKTYAEDLVVRDRPFDSDITFRFNQDVESRRSRILRPLLDAAVLNQKSLLSRAWKKIIDANMSPDLLAIWNELPMSEEQCLKTADALQNADAQTRNETRKKWRSFFQDKYQRILDSR